MASINTKQKIYTHGGVVARHITLTQQLMRTVMSCMLWENTFYEDGKTIAERIKELCASLVSTPAVIADIALKAKNDMRLRHVPLLLVRELFRCKENRDLAGRTLYEIISRPDDITEFLAIYWKDNRDEPLAKQAKLALGRAFHKFSAYQLAKYNGGSKAIKLVDALRIVHPTKSDLLGKLRRNELETPVTWEVELSKGGDKKETWTRLINGSKLGGLAFLRNIRNMREANIDMDLIRSGIEKIDSGRLLPINFIASAKHNPHFEPEIEKKFFECFGKEKVGGNTVLLIDVSGSMSDRLSGKSELTRADVASALAMIARETFDDMQLFSFSDTIVKLPARRGFAIKNMLDQQSHQCTYLGSAVRTIIAEVPHDRLIVITDEQSHDSVPDFKGYLINVASNKNGVGYGQCVHIDGWSDKVIDYIVQSEKSKLSDEV